MCDFFQRFCLTDLEGAHGFFRFPAPFVRVFLHHLLPIQLRQNVALDYKGFVFGENGKQAVDDHH